MEFLQGRAFNIVNGYAGVYALLEEGVVQFIQKRVEAPLGAVHKALFDQIEIFLRDGAVGFSGHPVSGGEAVHIRHRNVFHDIIVLLAGAGADIDFLSIDDFVLEPRVNFRIGQCCGIRAQGGHVTGQHIGIDDPHFQPLQVGYAGNGTGDRGELAEAVFRKAQELNVKHFLDFCDDGQELL